MIRRIPSEREQILAKAVSIYLWGYKVDKRHWASYSNLTKVLSNNVW